MIAKTVKNSITAQLQTLRSQLAGELLTDESTRLIYATDASAYREKPVAVAFPANTADIRKLIQFASNENIPLIPRTAGTSLAGQVVGSGMIVDLSRHFNSVIEINAAAQWVRLQPGVVPDELNKILAAFGLFFAPETSTSNRCMLGGMVGNNSCGAHSLIYGSTRDHLISVNAILSDGSEVQFNALSLDEFNEKCTLQTLEGRIYRNILELLSDDKNKDEIRAQYPEKSLRRRNTGYAIDVLLESEPFTSGAEKFNFCKLIAGSEGTLAFITEIKLNLVPLPPKENALVCVHCHSLDDAFNGNLIALRLKPVSVELIDENIIARAAESAGQKKNMFFIEGRPAAVLLVEFAFETKEEILKTAAELESKMRAAGYGYHFPLISGGDISKVYALRKAGLGLLTNIPGDAKPVSVIEDTAVDPAVLPQYMKEFRQMLDKLDLDCVYYAHIATGELHTKPVLNMKTAEGIEKFRTVALETARLVKKFNGSLSGEHGDGRLRGEFIPLMIGHHNYQLLLSIKATWDPSGIFNPGKITATPAMDTFLRYEAGKEQRSFETYFDFSSTVGFTGAIEQCNGSADCRKTEKIGGTMCPSYMATRDEHHATRARANLIREIFSSPDIKDPWGSKEVHDILDLCLSCKGCKTECPSGIDMARYKSEFLQHFHDAHGTPLRTRMVAGVDTLNRMAALAPGLYNVLIKNSFTSSVISSILGFAPQRALPKLGRITLKKWMQKNLQTLNNAIEGSSKGKVFLFADEFTNYNDPETGIKTIQLLNVMGYTVLSREHPESGRAAISKGMIRKARAFAVKNVELFKDIITSDTPLIGIEPSAIFGFRDEYPDLVGKELKAASMHLAANCLMVDEFIEREIAKGLDFRGLFKDDSMKILLHGHCHQKAASSVSSTVSMLSLPRNYAVETVPSGCCGMAGTFGFEKEHFEVSLKIGELVLFPAVRNADSHTIICAPGASCRMQISHGTQRLVKHPVEILWEALKTKV